MRLLRKLRNSAGACAMLAVSSAALAQTSPSPALPAAAGSHVSSKQLEQTKDQLGKMPKGSDLRPGGAISVTANRAELVQGSSAIYTGNVVMESDTLHMEGDRLELKQFPNSHYVATLTGAPSHMSHPSTGADDPPMTARAKTIIYDSRNNIADLVGDAFVTKGEQNISADTIHYNVAEKNILASGGNDGGRVHIVIPPAGETPSAAPPAANAAPAPASSPAPAPADSQK